MTGRRWFALAIMGATLARGEEISLETGLSRLETGNRALEAAKAKVVAATQTRKASYGNFLPVVKLQADATHLDRDIVMDFGEIRSGLIASEAQSAGYGAGYGAAASAGADGASPAAQQAMFNSVSGSVSKTLGSELETSLPPFQSTMKEQDDWSAQLVAYQPLFHGGRILAAERIAAAREKAATSDEEKQRGDLRRDFIKYYVQGSLLRQSIALRIGALESIEHHRDQARRILDQGMTDKATLLRAEMAMADAGTALADDSMKLQSIALTLQQMTASDEPVLPSDTLGAPPGLPGSEDSLERAVAERNPLLRSLSAQKDVAHKAVAVHDADFMPEIGLFGEYEFNRESAREALEPIWVVGVKGEITLFHGGVDYHQRAAALSTEREVSALRAEAASALEAQAKRQFLSLRQAKIRWGNLSAQSDLARENHRVTEARFAEGQATGMEVVDAWLAQEKTDLDRLAATGDAWTTLGEILWATGRTDEFGSIWTTGGRK
jgi:outer membrane protein TolC